MIGVVVGLQAEARMARALGAPVAVGGGSTAGAYAAATRLAASGVSGLLSFGLAGGLDPALRPGALIVPTCVIDDQGGRWETNAGLHRALGGDALTLLASSAIVGTAAAKRALWTMWGAAAIDMESGAVAQVAAAANLPFAIIRAVCDPGGADLPPAAMTALDAEGRIQSWQLVASLAQRPGQVAGLIRLASHAAAARRALLDRAKVVSLLLHLSASS